jgi:hypothetical protein
MNPYYDLNLPLLYRRIREARGQRLGLISSGEWVIHRKSPGDWCETSGPEDEHGGAEIIAIAVVHP